MDDGSQTMDQVERNLGENSGSQSANLDVEL